MRPLRPRKLVEVADSSLRFDLKTKAPIYATRVINAATLLTMVHKEPSSGAYEVSPSAVTASALVPSLAVSLGTLGVD